MSATKLRRKAFLATMGLMGLGLTALGRGSARPRPATSGLEGSPEGRVRKAPRAVPYSGRET